MRQLTIPHLLTLKKEHIKICVLTLYDACFASVASSAGVDILFVGDSLGMVLHGQDTTLQVTVENIAYHTAAVAKGNIDSLVMSDLPFMSYYSPEIAAVHCAILMRHGAQIIKIEGGAWLSDTVRFLTQRGVPVCGHIGLTPQFLHILGGFKVQGRHENAAKALLEDALCLEDAGANLLVLECVPYLLAQEITAAVSIPVIGIGAGPYCDGQVLVLHDILGITGKPKKFVKQYLGINGNSIEAAIQEYVNEVKNQHFPTLEHSFE